MLAMAKGKKPNPVAQAMAAMRVKKLSPERRSAIAKHAAQTRWAGSKSAKGNPASAMAAMRNKKLSRKQRTAIARKAAQARWGSKPNKVIGR